MTHNNPCPRSRVNSTLTPCLDPDYHLTVDGVVDPEPLTLHEPQVIDDQLVPLRSLLQLLKLQAPNAKVVLVGYPHVVYNASVWGPPGVGLGCGLLDAATIDWFDEMADRLIDVMSEAAAAEDALFVDPRERFGSHEACAPTDEWVNATIFESDSGSGVDRPGTGSFHPKGSGQQAYAEVVLEVVPRPK